MEDGGLGVTVGEVEVVEAVEEVTEVKLAEAEVGKVEEVVVSREGDEKDIFGEL